MSQAYSNPERTSDPNALPDVEVFYVGTLPYYRMLLDCFRCRWNAEEKHTMSPHYEHVGWYWQLDVDSEPNGPFATKEFALADAQKWLSISG